MDNKKIKLNKFIDENRTEIIGFYEKLVNIDTSSHNKEGVDRAIAMLGETYNKESGNVKIITQEDAGNTLVAEFYQEEQNHKPLILLGHVDTVFKKGEVKKRPFTIEDGFVYGPGVLDMKGGIVIITYVIKALNAIGFNYHPIKVIITGDEEIYHQNSNADKIIQEESRGALASFNLEGNYYGDELVVARKGNGKFTMTVKGVAAHAGQDIDKGKNAILELSHKIIAIQNLSHFQKGITFNVGTITGGEASNIVPEFAEIEVDIRYERQGAFSLISDKLEKVKNKVYVQGTKTELAGEKGIPPMEETDDNHNLLKFVNAVAKEFDLVEFKPIKSGGGADSAYSVLAGVPAIDGMGPYGRNPHNPDEYVELESLFEKTKLLGSCIMEIDKFASRYNNT